MSRRKRRVREAFRRNTLNRDGHQCRICGDTQDLVAHHITDRNKMPNGGYTTANGITLCPGCHLKAERYHQTGGEDWAEGFHPNDLYAKIGESWEDAWVASKRIGSFGLT